MNLDLRLLQDDCKTYSKPKRVSERLSNFTPELRLIAEDNNGKEVLETGVTLFSYLADVIIKKGEEGIETWNIVKRGYPGHAYTDLAAPFFDVTRTQLLWYNAAKRLNVPPVLQAEIVFNIYFRWYIATMELMRKMLVFTEYCRRIVANDLSDFKYNHNLYNAGDVTDSLRTRSSAGRGGVVCQFYELALRHALAHGNVVMALPHLVAVRQANTEPGKGVIKFEQTLYQFGPGSNSEDVDIIADFQRFADPCFQSMRVFFILYGWIEAKHIKVFKPHWEEKMDDDGVFRAIIEVTKADPEGLFHWTGTEENS